MSSTTPADRGPKEPVPVSPPAAFIFSKNYRMSVLLILLLVYVFSFVDRQIFWILLPQIKKDLVLSDTQLGILSGTAFALFYATLGIPIARLADRLNRRNIIAISITLWSVMTAACGMANSFSAMLAARMGVSIGEAGANPTSHSIISDYFAAKERGAALGIFGTGSIIASFIGFALGGVLAEAFGWRTTFILIGLPGMLVGLFVLLAVREPPRGHADAVSEKLERGSVGASLAHLVKCPTFRSIALAGAMQGFTGYTLLTWISSFFSRTHGLDLAQIGVTLGTVMLIGGMLGAIPGGHLADRLARRDLRWYVWIGGVSMFIGSGALLLIYIAPTPAQAFIACGIAVFLVNICLGPLFSVMQGVSPIATRASTSALYFLIVNLIGLGVGPPLIGVASDVLQFSFGFSEEAALRWALTCTVTLAPIVSAFFFWMAAFSIHRDFAVPHPGKKEQPALTRSAVT